ncbi:MAG: flavin reductase family protein [Phycisphaerales bacterium]|nr:MAG: flavin reductase family protein [Phycisphaerales bacterium]
MFIDLAETEHSWRAMYRLYLTFVQPRPIALVSTVSATGVANLAPFSCYTLISSNPPVVVFCPAIGRDGRPKDTLANIRATGEFVIATVTEGIAERMNICSTEFPAEVSEFEVSGLTPGKGRKTRPNLVADSPVNIECRLRQIVSIGEGPGGGQAVFGDVLAVHVDEGVLVEGDLRCDPAKLRAVGRMGGSLYARTTDRFSLESLRDPTEFARRGPARLEGA